MCSKKQNKSQYFKISDYLKTPLGSEALPRITELFDFCVQSCSIISHTSHILSRRYYGSKDSVRLSKTQSKSVMSFIAAELLKSINPPGRKKKPESSGFQFV